MTDMGVGRGRRPRSTAAQWIIAAVLVVMLTVVGMTAALWWAWLDSALGQVGELEDTQVFQEVVCVPYATGVLDLAAQGYTAEQIEAAYTVAAAPHDGTEPRDEDTPPSVLVEYCGSPAQILAVAPSGGR